MDLPATRLNPSLYLFYKTFFYRVSLTRVKDKEAKIIFSGSDIQFHGSNLEPKTEYTIRVCGVRIPVPGTELAGPFSPPAIFTTMSNDGSDTSASGQILSKRVTSSSGVVTKRDNTGWSDKQWAFVLVVGFTLFALFIALVMQLIIER